MNWTRQPNTSVMVSISNFRYKTSIPSWTKGKKFIRVIRHQDYEGWAVQKGHFHKEYKPDWAIVTKEHKVDDKNKGIRFIKNFIRTPKSMLWYNV